MKKRALFFLLGVLVICLEGCGPSIRKTCGKVNKTIKKGSFEQKYSTALCYYQNERYYQASLLFDDISSQIVGTDSAENVEFYQSYCYYNLENYFYAAHYFRKFFKKYPRSKYAEEANYMHVMSLYKSSAPYYLDQQSTYDAIRACQSFINKYPRSAYLEKSNDIIDELQAKLEKKAFENAKLYLKTHRYKAAVVAFENFPDKYPDSDYNEELAFLKIEAQYNLAENSQEIIREDGKTITLKLDRFREAQEFYLSFVDRFPKSAYLKDAKGLYEQTLAQIKKLEPNNKL